MKDQNNQTERPLLEIRKYQNRRYYDTTNSEHLSMEQIHKMIGDGYNIRVVDAKTETDITSKVLTQILLDYEPMKLDFFSADLLLQVIRVNDKLLKDFIDVYFGQAFALFLQSKRQYETILRDSRLLPSFGWPSKSLPYTAALELFNPMSSLFGLRESASSEELAKEVASLRQQVEALQAEARPRARKKA